MRTWMMVVAWGVSAGVVAAASHSELWGAGGEKWNSRSRLPDFSHAGYQRGEKPLPEVGVTSNLRDFGAQGDGIADDTAAFERAFRDAPEGAILVPRGRYVITRAVEIRRPRLVLRGEDRDGVVLVFPEPLNESKPNWGATTGGRRTSNYSWSGGFLAIRGSLQSKVLTKVAEPARRGDQTLRVTDATPLRVGQEIEIYQSDLEDNSLMAHLYSGDPGDMSHVNGRARTSLVTKITKIEGETVHIDRPLRTDVELRWMPTLRNFEPTVRHSGLENLSFEFPDIPYAGHFTELGNNPLAFHSAVDCWVRNVRVKNPDSGMFLQGYFNTVEGMLLETERRPDQQNCTGHHGVLLGGGDNLLRHFEIRMRFIHDLTVSGPHSGNVFASGKALDLSLDHHCLGPYGNLFTDLDAGEGTRLWHSGGGQGLGKHCASGGTFWGIRSKRFVAYPSSGFGPPSLNLVGLSTEDRGEIARDGLWRESIAPEKLEPVNLWQAQRDRRLKLDGGAP